MPIYVCVLSNATYFVTFPDVAIVRCSRKYLFLKYGKKIGAEFLEILEVAIFFQGFARITGQFLFFKTSFADIFRNIHFFVVRFYMQSKKQSVGSAHEVSTDSSERVFEDAHFIINSHGFLQPLTLSRHNFPRSGSFVPHSHRHKNFQNFSPLDKFETALV